MFGSIARPRPGRRAPRAPPFEHAGSRSPRAGRRASASSRYGAREAHSPVAPPEERRERPEPVALGRERDVRHAGRGEHRRELAPLLGGGLREPLAHDRIVGVDEHLARRSRDRTRCSSPMSASSCSRGSRISTASVAMARGDAQKRALPVDRAAEVRDDDDERALDRERRRRASARRRGCRCRPERRGSRRARAAVRGVPGAAGGRAARRRRTRRRRAGSRGASRRGRSRSRRPRRRPPCGGRRCRTASRPKRRARATSRARARRARRARASAPVRAVTFQSIRRTSSPGLVRPHLVELGPDAGERRAEVAGEQPADPPADREVERAQALAA